MEWWQVLTLFLGGLMVLLLLGFPIAFSFLLVDLVAVFFFLGVPGIKQIPVHVYSGLNTFTLVPIPLFILMGELMFHSKIAYNTIDVIDKWLTRLPGRLSLLAAISGTIFAATSGSSMANTAMLGTVLVPEMKNKGYHYTMSLGPIMGVGGLAMLIPPSALAVVFASIAQISVTKILMGGLIPGLILGAIFFVYIIIRCAINPKLAPKYESADITMAEKIRGTIKYVLPMCFIIFMVLGLILLGVATPSEAAASGVIATLIVIILYRRLTWDVVKSSLVGTVQVAGMTLFIVAASKTFSAILAYTGATQGLLNTVSGLDVSPLVILICIQLIVFFLGAFMETVSIMMICLPIFIPICKLLGFDPIWFGVIMLVNLEMGQITPPFGMLLFVMKGVVKDVSLAKICWAAFPYIIFDIILMIMIMIWPGIALWLPSIVSNV